MVKIFIGTEEAQWLPTQVLRHSVLRRTKSPVEFTDLINLPIQLNLRMYTGFSFYRFYIPEACNYTGRAIYLDADIIVLDDIQKLNDLDMGGKNALARRDEEAVNEYFTSVMLLDCEKLKHWKIKNWSALINAGMGNYEGTMIGSPRGLNANDFGPLPPLWNRLDNWTEGTLALHYTTVPTQPWKVPGHRYANLFLTELKSALDEKFLTKADVEREIQKGFIYPKILADVENLR